LTYRTICPTMWVERHLMHFSEKERMRKDMKKIVAILLLVVMLFSFSGCGESYRRKLGNNAVEMVQSMEKIPDDIKSGCSAEKYTMDITLDDAKNKISGTVRVDIVNNTGNKLDKLCFNLFCASISSDSKISAAENSETKSKYSVEAGNSTSTFYVNLGKDGIEKGGKLSVNLKFTTMIPEINDRFGYYQDENGKLYNLSFCFPQIAFMENGEWIEEEYGEGLGEVRYSEMSDWFITFKTPEKYELITTGKIVSEDDGFVIEAENVREIAMAVCNFAEIITEESEGITYNLMMPEYEGYKAEWIKDYAEVLMTTAIESVEIYTEAFGEYIYDELDIVPVFYGDGVGGMEYPGLVQVSMVGLSGESDEGIDCCDDGIVSTCHEVGHQWFYCAVGNNEGREPWLDESFTSYIETYFCVNAKESIKKGEKFNMKYGGTDELSDMSSFNDVAMSDFYINFPFNAYEGDDYNYVYSDGAEFLRALELAMGEKAFIKMLSDWYNENINEIVTGAEFISFVLEYDSSEEVVDIINKFISEEQI